MESDLARCDREIAAIQQHPEVLAGAAPAWIAAMGEADWRIEKRMIETERAQAYEDFLAAKQIAPETRGVPCQPSDCRPILKPHQRDIVHWAVRGGARAIFASFGLGKSFMQLEIGRLIQQAAGGRFLIVAPLGVRQEFLRDAIKLGTELRFVRRIEECGPTGLYLTNYETVRDGKLNPREFVGASLDEASCLRGLGGTKTFREFMRLFDGMRYKFVATATPSPNEYIELLAYAAFLEVMDVGQAKTRFFKRDSTKADKLTLHGHKESEFWLWMASWAIFLQKPSDLGYSDEGYDLPPIDIRWHEVPTDYSDTQVETNGQMRLVKHTAIGVVDASREKRSSLRTRIAKVLELRAEDLSAHRIIWHDLESERRALEAAIPGLVTVWGSQDMDRREQAIADFSDGMVDELATKPVIAGSGCNFQRHCAWAIFMGIGFKFNDFIQSIHRIHRFLQDRPVRIDLIYTEAEREVRRILEKKWRDHKIMVAKMTDIIREFGLSRSALASLNRSSGLGRIEETGEHWKMVNNDSVLETRTMPEKSVHLVLTSIPFSTQYEYTPSYNDFGHTDSNEHFWQQMDFLTPELFRVLKPGRIACIHVKDRIIPGGINGLGFQTVYPFHSDAIRHFEKHGFAYMGMKTIVTDVVRENNQTYRLGWTEQCKDGTKMGVGMPEYLLLFRRPPSENTNSYADEPVVKDKGAYSRSRWQIDAHGFTRSSGERLLTPGELDRLNHGQIFRLFRKHSLENVYDFEAHVRLGEALEAKRILPVTFMLLQPHSWSDEVWADVTRMLSLNSTQSAKGAEMHLCPMQFDIADRAITQFTMPGETVYDPFAGLGTVPYRAVLMERRGIGVELNSHYFTDAVAYCQAAEDKMAMPTLFSLKELEDSKLEEMAEVGSLDTRTD